MIQIIVNNSYSQITGQTAALFSDLKKVLAYHPDATASYFSRGYSRPSYLIDRKGNFPTGLLSKVLKLLKENKIEAKVKDLRKRPLKKTPLIADFGSLSPRLEQLDAANIAAANKRGIISAATGSGKSLIIAILIQKLQVRTLIVTPSVELKNQLQTSMELWFGKKNVGKGKNIYIENVQSLDPAVKQLGYDCVCIDEFHHSGAKTYRKLNKQAWTDIYYRFGFTATPFRNADNEKILLESVLSDIIYGLSMKKAINSKYIVPVEAFYFEVPKQPTNAYTWAEVYNSLIVNNDKRNALLAWLLDSFAGPEIPTLCLVKEIAHGIILSDLTGIPFANGKDAESRRFIEQFNKGEITSLIGTTGILGEGIDTKPAEVIIIAGLGKAKSAFLQQIGRGVRLYKGKESCKVILFRDTSHKFCLRHYKEQCKILKDELGIVPVKLEEP